MLEKAEQDITPAQEVYRAVYLYGEKKLEIRIKTYLSIGTYSYEVGEDILERYTVAGVDYYLFDNVNQLRAVWITSSYECNISGDVSLNEIK